MKWAIKIMFERNVKKNFKKIHLFPITYTRISDLINGRMILHHYK